MAESLTIAATKSKAEQYESLLPQINALIEGEDNLTANLANVSAALKEAFGFWWVGFYLMQGETLVLGPFQGPVACTRINLGKGVCGTAAESKQTLLVPDVDQFPGHIACSAASKSEIVVPILKEGKTLGVLDVDSEHLAHFDELDKKYLEQLCQNLAKLSWK